MIRIVNTYKIASIGNVRGGYGYCVTHREEFLLCLSIDSVGTVTILVKSPKDDKDTRERIETAINLFNEMIQHGEIEY